MAGTTLGDNIPTMINNFLHVGSFHQWEASLKEILTQSKATYWLRTIYYKIVLLFSILQSLFQKPDKQI